MRNTIKAFISAGEKYYVGECLELPVVTQGKTIEETVHNLQEAVALQLEGEEVGQWDLSPHPHLLISMELDPAVNA